jgi:hypothetical protein
MMVDFRPVDCDTKRPIQFDPGFISDKIFEVSPVRKREYAGCRELNSPSAWVDVKKWRHQP